jgi:hypothetical protein
VSPSRLKWLAVYWPVNGFACYAAGFMHGTWFALRKPGPDLLADVWFWLAAGAGAVNVGTGLWLAAQAYRRHGG